MGEGDRERSEAVAGAVNVVRNNCPFRLAWRCSLGTSPISLSLDGGGNGERAVEASRACTGEVAHPP